jgi:pyruvate,water dikinase
MESASARFRQRFLAEHPDREGFRLSAARAQAPAPAPLVVDLFAEECLQPAVSGGKASSLAALVREGIPIAPAVCVTAASFDAHLQSLHAELSALAETLAGVRGAMLGGGVSAWDPAAAQAEEAATQRLHKQLAQLRKNILSQPLSAHVLLPIQEFLDSLPEGATVAVRSSATAEDAAVQSFAGQFDSFLNVPRTVAAVELAIKRCFASVFQPHIFEHKPELKELRMAVLVQRQIASVTAGVLFTGNPVTRKRDQIVVEAVFGQGVGAVSGEFTPARYIADSGTGAILSFTQQQQTHKYALIGDGIGLVPLSAEEQKTSCLDRDALESLVETAKVIQENRYGQPQDLEFCLERHAGKTIVQIVQVRPITTKFELNLNWEAPGPGPWEQDAGHFPRCLSLFLASYFPSGLAEGFRSGFARYGILLEFVEVKTVNGIWYQRPRAIGAPPDASGPPPQAVFEQLILRSPLKERLATAEHAAEDRLWRKDLALWDAELKPRALQRNRALQAVSLAMLSDEDLKAHFDECYAHLLEMVKMRFFLTPAALVPLGDLLAHAHDFLAESGLPLVPSAVLTLLSGSTGGSLGVLGERHAGLVSAFKADDAARRLLFDAQVSAGARIYRLLNWAGSGTVGEAMRAYVYDDGAGLRIIEGYDIDCKTGLEQPELLLAGIQELIAGPGTNKLNQHASKSAALEAFLLRLPEQRRGEFRELFREAELMNRLRDERSLYTDVWAVGILRGIYLEIGRRLLRRHQLPSAALILEASPIAELERLLVNDAQKPAVSVLAERAEFRKNVTAESGPKTLGPQLRPPPPVEWLPVPTRRIERAMRFALGNIWTARRPDTAGDTAGESDRVLRGDGGSAGTVVGVAVVLDGPNELSQVKRGDILVTASTTAAFNVVLPLLAGIVTDTGGILSHAAIVAREFGIPCVVGAQKATQKIKTGDTVEVNGSTGQVSIRRRSHAMEVAAEMKSAQSLLDRRVPQFMTKFTAAAPEPSEPQDFDVPTYVIRPDQLLSDIETYTQVNTRWASKLASIPRLFLDDAWLMEAFSLTEQQLAGQRALFNKHDVKKQRSLDADALLQFFLHMGQKRSLNDVNLIFKEWDIDSDGLCTFAEWVTVVNGLPSRLSVDLYLGNMYNAQSARVIESLQITHIINVAPSRAKCVFRDRGVKYLEIDIEDDDSADILRHLPAFSAFIAEARQQAGSRILVHCTMGMSRSASLVIGHYMTSRTWTLSETYFYVKACRRVVSPNQSFLRQLLTLATDQSREQLTQTRLRVSMIKEAFHVNDGVIATIQKLFERMAPNGKTMGVGDLIRFEDFVLGIRRSNDDEFSKEYGGLLRIKHWDILGNCFVTLPQLIANLKGIPSEFLPNIFVGTNFVAIDPEMLRDLRITHTVDCSLQRNRTPEYVVTIHVPLDDAVVLEGAEVDALMEPAFQVADEVAASKDKALFIHDPIGLVKTCMFCICYLMKRRKWTFAQANYYAMSRVRGFNVSIVWALYRSTVNYALYLNPSDRIPQNGVFLYADANHTAAPPGR